MKENLIAKVAIIQLIILLTIACGVILFIWFNWVVCVKIEGSFIILYAIGELCAKVLEKYQTNDLSIGNPDKDNIGT